MANMNTCVLQISLKTPTLLSTSQLLPSYDTIQYDYILCTQKSQVYHT